MTQPSPAEPDRRWICFQCADLDLLDDEGLCCACRQPEHVATFAEIASQALHGVVEQPRPRWRIG